MVGGKKYPYTKAGKAAAKKAEKRQVYVHGGDAMKKAKSC